MKKEILIGQRFGSRVVIGFSGKDKINNFLWLCMCDCGTKSTIRATLLRNGKSKSCIACSNKANVGASFKHGHATVCGASKEYYTWNSMIGRCHNVKHRQYSEYGGRGITVCEEWRKSFINFFNDMGPKPSPSLSLDRMDNNKGYYKGNCRWATKSEQQRNTRANKYIEHNGEKLLLTDWAKRLKTGGTSIRQMLKRGKSFSEVISYYSKTG